MIRYNELTAPSEIGTVQFLKETLVKILSDDQTFSEESQSMALLLLGDMALKNYHEAINDDIDIAIDTF